MIATLKGTVSHKFEDKIVLDVHDVGYEIHCPARSVASFECGQNLFLHTYLSIKEDAHTLFGFENEQEKKAFLLLLSVSGVGPKTAAQVISATTVDILIKHVLKNDAPALSLIKGIGKKTAERIVLELKEKIAKTFGETGMTESASSPSQIRSENFSALEDAQAALMALGYKFREIQMVIDKNRANIKDGMSTEDIVRVLLQNVH